MKRKICIAAILLLSTILVGYGLLLKSRHDYPEPSYAGHSLYQWLLSYYYGHQDNSRLNWKEKYRQRETAMTAIRAIGTNALPSAVRWLGEDYYLRDYPEEGALIFYHRYGLSGMAEDIFEILGTQAEPAVPELIQISHHHKDPKVRYEAMRMLLRITFNGEKLLPAFIWSAEMDPDPKIRASALGDAVQGIGMDKERGLALLAVAAKDSDEKVRHLAQVYQKRADEWLDFFCETPAEIGFILKSHDQIDHENSP